MNDDHDSFNAKKAGASRRGLLIGSALAAGTAAAFAGTPDADRKSVV